MKKLYFFIFLCVVLIFCAIGCADESSSSEASENTPPNSVETENDPTDSTQTVDTITPEEAVNIYLSERDAWMYSGETIPLNGYGYCLIDLDLDGVLELITSVCDGSGKYSYNSFYMIDREERKVKEISQAVKSQGNSGVDYYYMASDSKLLKNKSDSSFVYLFADQVRVGANEGLLAYAKVCLKDGKVFEDGLFSKYWSPNHSNDLAPIFEYYVDGALVTYDEYTKASDDFFEEYEDMRLHFECIVGSDFDKASEKEKKQLLLDAYLNFSYADPQS